MIRNYLIFLPLLSIAMPFFGAQQSAQFRPVTPNPIECNGASVNYDSVAVLKSPDVLEMLHKTRQSPTDFSDPKKTASPVVRTLCYEAICNVQEHFKNFKIDPTQVFALASNKTSASKMDYTTEQTLTSGKKVSRKYVIPFFKIHADTFMKRGGHGALRIAAHHEAAHMVLKHPTSEFSLEIIADETAARSGKCKLCCVSAAHQHWQMAKGFKNYRFTDIQNMSDEEIKKYIEEFHAQELPKKLKHPSDIHRCFRFIHLSRPITTICNHHQQKMDTSQSHSSSSSKKRSEHPEQQESPSPTKKMKLKKTEEPKDEKNEKNNKNEGA